MVGPHVPNHAEAVAETLDALTLGPEDAAAADLARTYAGHLDRASAIETQADKALRKAGDDPELMELVSALRQKLTAHAIHATFGPKLLDVLTALGAHPKARAALGKGGPARGPSKLAALRAAGK